MPRKLSEKPELQNHSLPVTSLNPNVPEFIPTFVSATIEARDEHEEPAKWVEVSWRLLRFRFLTLGKNCSKVRINDRLEQKSFRKSTLKPDEELDFLFDEDIDIPAGKHNQFSSL